MDSLMRSHLDRPPQGLVVFVWGHVREDACWRGGGLVAGRRARRTGMRLIPATQEVSACGCPAGPLSISRRRT